MNEKMTIWLIVVAVVVMTVETQGQEFQLSNEHLDVTSYYETGTLYFSTADVLECQVALKTSHYLRVQNQPV